MAQAVKEEDIEEIIISYSLSFTYDDLIYTYFPRYSIEKIHKEFEPKSS